MNSKFLSLVAIITLLNFYSCKKNNDSPPPEPPSIELEETKFRFFLYTTEDFSNSTEEISFKMNIRNNHNLVVDSSLVTMRVKDIPREANKLVFERTVKANQPGILRAGFVYTIKNVGMAWHFENCPAGIPEKIIDFNFR